MSILLQVETIVRHQPRSQFVQVPPTLYGGGSAARTSQRRPTSSIYSCATDDMNSTRASSVYPPTISPPDSPRLSDASESQPNISPISTNAPAQPWLKPSGIPAPRRLSPSESPIIVPEQHASSTSGWREAVKTVGRTLSPSPPAPLSKQNSDPTRWDAYSGEKTIDQRGKAGSASPSQHPYKGTDPGFGYTATISAGGDLNNKPSHFLHVKLRKATERKPAPSPQEPWRGPSGVMGPSGRSASVEPITERAATAERRHFPTPAERRARGLFAKAGASGRTSPGPAVGLGLRSATPTGRETTQPDDRSGGLRSALDSAREAVAKAIPQKERAATDPIRPNTSAGPRGEAVVSETRVFKYKIGGSRSGSRDDVPPISTDFGPPVNNRQHHTLQRIPSQDMLRGAYPEHAGPRAAATMPVHTSNFSDSPMSYEPPNKSYTIPPRKDSRYPAPMSASAVEDYDQHKIASAFHNMGFSNEPKSHFSATTYSASVAADSPPTTPRMPGMDDVPPLPSSAPAGVSILNRKRPVPSSTNQYKPKTPQQPPQRKPAPGNSAVVNSDGTVTPPEPGQLQQQQEQQQPQEPIKPVDRVMQLEEKLASLNKRKTSLAAVIHELTNVVQPSSIAYDMASRSEIKKTVEGLRIEQDAVLKEIQEVGIKLHRAYKKRDEELNAGGGTSLWVRRVTE